MLILFCFFAVLLLLLVATYGDRSACVTLCSTGMSVATLTGFLFIVDFEGANQVRSGLVLAARQLPSVLDQRTLVELRTAIDSSLPNCKGPPGCKTASYVGSMQYDQSPSDEPSSEAPAPKKAAADAGRLETRKDFDEVAQWPISWLPDDSTLQVSANPKPSFSITGINISDNPLSAVQAILKSDVNHQEIKLTVRVEGERFGSETIPAGTRFTLGAAPPNNEKHVGGAVLVFRYTYAGQRRAEIFYLTATMIAGLASPS